MRVKILLTSCAIAIAIAFAGQASAQNDYKCYKIKKDAVSFPATASVVDQFSSISAELKKGFLVCNPANVAGAGAPPNPANHLLCYKAKGDKLDPPPHVSMTNDFGNSTLFAKKTFLVCMDSTKSVIP